MKKILNFSTMFLFLICMSLSLVACEPTLVKIYADLESIKTEYYLGEQQETYENAKVLALYSNGDLKPINDTENITFSTIDTSELGFKTLIITYNGKTLNIPINVREKRITDLTITGLKTSYVVGETQNNNCSISAIYEDGTTETVDLANVTFSNISTDEVSSSQKIRVTYKGFHKDIPVNVASKPVEGIRFVENSIKTEYFQKEQFLGFDGAKVLLVYEDQTTENIVFENLEFTPIETIDTNVVKSYTVKVSFLSYETTFTINVNERIIEAINIVETGLKTSYDVGDIVDSYENLQITISYSNQTEETILVSSLDGAVLTKPETTTVGSDELTVTYEGFTDSVTITINALDIHSLTLTVNKTDYIKGSDDTLNKSDISVNMTYNGGKQTTLDLESLSTRNVELVAKGLLDNRFSESGYIELKAKAGNVESNTVTVNVYSSIHDTYYITFKNPEFMDDFYSNSGKNDLTSKFKIEEKTYVIGDDNNFIFFPTISAYKDLDEFLNPEAEGEKPSTYKLNFKVEERINKDSPYTVLEGDALSDKVTINDEKGLLQFSNEAINKQYKITVTPYFTHVGNNSNKTAIEFEFEVQDGYNVYKEEELCLFDNCNSKIFDSDEKGVWTEFKETKGYNFTVNGLFLHKKLVISDSENVLPKGYFHQAGAPTTPSTSAIGSLVDYEYIYKRNIDGENFVFNGNYFQIDVRSLPLVEFFGDDNSEKLSHSSLFYTLGDGSVVFENIDVFGNGQRENNELLAGGIILAKISTDSEAVFENVHTKALFTSYFSEYGATMTMNNCISSDNFSCILYSYGNNVNNVNNCEFTRCGGPIAIITHEKPEEAPYDRFGILNIDKNSIMHNPVTFEEGWFNAVGASDLVTYFPLLDQLLNLSSGGLKNIRKDGYCNLVAVVMNGTDPKASSSKPVQGKVTYGDSTLNMLYNSESDYTKLIGTFNSLEKEQPPLFQAGGKTYYTDAQTGIYDTPASLTQITAASSPEFFNDKYIGLSLPTGGNEGRIGVLVEFFGELPQQEE